MAAINVVPAVPVAAAANTGPWPEPTSPNTQLAAVDPASKVSDVEVPIAQAVWAETSRPLIQPTKTSLCSCAIACALFIQVMLLASLTLLILLAANVADPVGDSIHLVNRCDSDGYELGNPAAGLKHEGQDCWNECSAKQGTCAWCGAGVCCRHGWSDTGNGCSGQHGVAGTARHVCVAANLASTGTTTGQSSGKGACTSWRQTGGCSASGRREPGSDRSCESGISPGNSGYCECENGRKAALTGCEGHAGFTCAQKCMLGGAATSTTAGFTKFADGYCQDWAYPNDSGYDTVSTTAAICMERCRSKYPGTTSFYLKGTKCGCAKSTPQGRCAVTASAGYTAYEISGSGSAATATDGASDAETKASVDVHFCSDIVPFIVVVLISFVAMLVECACCSPSRKFLKNFKSDRGAYEHVEKVRQAGPLINWSVQCYHYETQYYTETVTDSEGNSHYEQRTRQVRVNTWSASMNYIPWAWEDITSELPELASAQLTRLTFSKMYTFADAASATHFYNMKNEFKWRNRRDQYMDFFERFEVPGFESHMLAATDVSQVPKWLTLQNYFIATALCCTVPFRMRFAAISWNLPDFKYVKRIYAPGSLRVEAPVPIVAPAWPVSNAMPIAVASAIPMDQVAVQVDAAPLRPAGPALAQPPQYDGLAAHVGQWDDSRTPTSMPTTTAVAVMTAPPPSFSGPPATAVAPAPGGTGTTSVADELQGLVVLRQQGILDEEEFAAAKAKVLASP